MKLENETEANKNSEDQATIEDHHDETDHIDLSKFNKKDLLQLLQNIKVEENINKANNLIKDIKLHFDNIQEGEKNTALNAFIESGGEASDFELKKDEVTIAFE